MTASRSLTLAALGDAVLQWAADGCANWLASEVSRGRDDIAAKL
jgi:hypothetical protein